MGFYPPDALVHEAQRRGLAVRAADVNASEVECSVERATDSEQRTADSLAVRIGLGYITGLRAEDAKTVVHERGLGGPYRDLGDLASRSGVRRQALELLAWAGACSGIEGGIAVSEARAQVATRCEGRRCGDSGSRAAPSAGSSRCPSRCPALRRSASSTPGRSPSPTTVQPGHAECASAGADAPRA